MNYVFSSPLCTHYTFPFPNLLYPLQRDLPGTSSPLRCFLFVPYLTKSPQIAALPPLPALPTLVFISLSVLCKRCIHMVCKRAHGQLHSVFTRAGTEACQWFKHGKHILNGCLLHSVGDVITCAPWAKFNILHMQVAKRDATRRKTYDQKRQSTIGSCISSLQQTSLS